MEKMKDQIDVMILCGGSATDLPEMTHEVAKSFHVIDSFDTHANIPEHFARVDAEAKAGGKIAVISVGWDPGLFSLNRLYANAILPNGTDYTFWGKGVSQGHSDAVRRIPGVLDARQYTVPVPEAVSRVLAGENPELTTREKHTRECYVVAAEGADKAAIETAIKTMPNYFSDYNTSVTFISQEEMDRDHSGLPHGGSVIRSGVTGFNGETKHTIEYTLTLESNPEFTASVLVACARAAVRMAAAGDCGCKTIFDIPPAALSPLSGEELRATML
jgi:diaminopimelate dehydrogenase